MNIPKYILASLAGGVATVVLDGLLHGNLLTQFFQENTGSATGVMKAHINLWALLIGNFGMGFLIAYIYEHLADIHTAGKGAKTGGILGLLIALTFDFTMFGTTNLMNLSAVIVDILVWGVISSIVGTVVALVLGYGR